MRFPLLLVLLMTCAEASAMDCPPPPPSIRDIKAQGYYVDAAHSVIDEDARRENARMTAPLNAYIKTVTDLSDRYLAGHDVSAGQCAVTWMDRWAQDGALLGQMVHINNDQADYLRQWVQGSVAIAWLKTRALASAGQRVQIDAWLRQVSAANLAYWNNPKKKRNNHYYWTGVGIMATAVATDDDALLEAAQAIYQKGVNDIRDDGSLPMEMARGSLALHYHNYALAPLVLMAEMARLKGLDWYAYDNNRINLLAERVASGYRDSTWFAQQAGVPQKARKPDGEAGWVEFYRLRAPHPALFDALHDAGPFEDPRMGGNLTLMARVGMRPQA
jgi:poly(beta-D-mannuronate) lyase